MYNLGMSSSIRSTSGEKNFKNKNQNLNAQIVNASETIHFLENENKIKSNEIEELTKDVKHLMDVRSELKRKNFKNEQKIKGLQQVVVKDLKTKLSKKARFI